MPADLDAALRAAVRDVLPGVAGVAGVAEDAKGDLWRWRPDGVGGWTSPAPRRLAAAARMPLPVLETRLAAAFVAALAGRLGGDADGAVGVGDGFLVVTPGAEALGSVVAAVLAVGPAYGRPDGPVSPLVVDPTVPQRRTPDNPLFVVMWAHARCAVLIDRATGDVERGIAVTPTTAERVLVLLLADLPRAVADAGHPATLLRRVLEVADATHGWLAEFEGPGTGRPELVAAARQVLATGLDLLGLPAPDHL